jgi:hypothetical protein
MYAGQRSQYGYFLLSMGDSADMDISKSVTQFTSLKNRAVFFKNEQSKERVLLVSQSAGRKRPRYRGTNWGRGQGGMVLI